FEIEYPPNRALQLLLVHFASAEGIDADTHRFWMANRIGELDFATIRQPGGNHILRDPTPHVSRAAIDLRGIFARKRATAVSAHPAVGIANNLASCDTCVAFRATDDKAARGVNQVSRLLVQPLGGHHFFDEEFD